MSQIRKENSGCFNFDNNEDARFEDTRHKIQQYLVYHHVAAHLLSRGLLSMPEHRFIMAMPKGDQAKIMINMISNRPKAFDEFILALNDPDLLGIYDFLIRLIGRHVHL